MIVTKGTNVLKILGLMEACPFQFYETGSRVFGGFTNNSDYDFFAQNSEAIVKALDEMGFNVYTYAEYTDKNTVAVYRHENQMIDIQLQHIVSAKIQAQSLLLRLNGWIRLVEIPKQDRAFLWNQVYLALGRIE